MILMSILALTSVDGKLFESDSFKTKGGEPLKITFIKHGSLMLDFDGRILYVDPVSDYADYSQLPKADVILITHEHADHLDPKAIAAVEKAGTVLIANPASQEKLGKGRMMKNGDRLKPLPWLALEAVPAYNTTPGREIYHPKGRDNGYILTLGGSRIYIAGDTEETPQMDELKDIDIAFLPVNQPYTMTVQQAAHAAEVIRPRVLYPYHYGNTELKGLKEALKNSPQIDLRIRQLQ